MKWQVLNATAHRQHGWRRPTGLALARQEAFAPLVLAELAPALPQYPLALARLPGGEYRLGAVLGLTAGQNLWMDDSACWRGGYVPSCFRGHPFALQRLPGEEARVALCFDVDSGLYCEAPDAARGELRFFDDDGQPQAVTQQMLQFLQSRLTAQTQTQTAVNALAQAGLLVPWVWPAQLPLPPGAQPLQGLYRVDETRLNQLDATGLLALRQTQALPVAYAQMFSMPRLAVLQKMAASPTPVPPPAPDLSAVQKLFEPGQPDTIQFNW